MLSFTKALYSHKYTTKKEKRKKDQSVGYTSKGCVKVEYLICISDRVFSCNTLYHPSSQQALKETLVTQGNWK